MPLSLTHQILKDHLAAGELRPGSPISIHMDQALLQDATGTMALMQFEELGVPRIKVERAVQYVDHNVVQLDYKNADDHRMLQALARKYGLHFSRPGNGISHYVHMERFGKPGQTMLGADSHTTQAGCLGMLAIGAGGLDVAVVLGGHPYEIASPEVVEVHLSGTLDRPWVQAKDIILELLRRVRASGGKNKVFEFTGPGTADLSVPERATIANMVADLGGTAGVFPPDETTRSWLERQDRAGDFAEVGPDHGAEYDERIEIDLGALGPLVAKPHNPDNVVGVEEVAGTEIAQVCIGSSVNSGYNDLALPGAVLADRGGQIVNPRLAATATPGSRQILAAIAESGVYRQLSDGGVRMLEPVCGPCVGMGQAPPSDANSLRTFNRNFPGRSGTPEDSVFLCSPAVAAVSLLTGRIEDPRQYGDAPELLPMPELRPYVDDVHIFAPADDAEAERIEIPRGPNIKRPPEHRPLGDALEARIATVQPDDISTGDLAPDGVEVMAYRSNVPAIAEFTLRHRDPEFRRRLKEWGSGFIVAGENYGQGSSREHAALAPLHLGVKAVIAKSFARIHRRNLIAQGIVALTFDDPSDYDRAEVGQTWQLRELRHELEQGAETIAARIEEGGQELVLRHDFSESERAILLAGGLLSHLRESEGTGGADSGAGRAEQRDAGERAHDGGGGGDSGGGDGGRREDEGLIREAGQGVGGHHE
ncbi:MAG: aconitate hydratase [Solirubrobacterales bacterium]|nr:aconitate hydratase [Solirubrobacterales bacterium]MBV9714682.1 aconitate hydratase [Solirubrobacterales bacterium]